MGDVQPTDDPGWPGFWAVFFPWWPGNRTASDPLVALRMTFLAFCIALVMFAFVLSVFEVPDGPVVPWLPIVGALAAVSVVAARVLTAKPLDCASNASLAATYRNRFFLAIGLSEYVALAALAFTFIGGPRWLYDVGGVFSLVQFWTVAPPTRAGIRRDQERLTAAGCELSLVAALRGTPSPPPRWRR